MRLCGVVSLCCGVVTVVVSPSPQALASHRAYLLTARVPSKVSRADSVCLLKIFG